MKNTPIKIPLLDRRTLEWLNQLNPEKAARRHDTIEDIWMLAGKRELINKALMEMERQDKGL